MPATNLAPTAEWSLLQAACSAAICPEGEERVRRALFAPIRWKVLIDLADVHGVQPLLHQALARTEDAVPAEAMQRLTDSYQSNVQKTLLLARELIRIVDQLSAQRIEVIPYKGVALAEAVYGDIALRQSGDIDLLILASDLPRIREALRGLGYTPHSPLTEAKERAYLKSGYECVLDGEAGRNLLEVQWAIQPRFYAVEFDIDGVFKRAVTIPVAGRPMKTLSAEDLFLVLSLHAAKHVWGRLIWLCDVARILRMPNLNWTWIGYQAKELGIVRILRVTLLLLDRLLGTPIQGGLESALPGDSAVQPLAQQIQSYVAGGTPFDVESLAYFRLMLRLRERRADQMRFLTRLAFTPGPAEWAAIDLPPRLFPLYRIVRLSRLARRLVRP